MVVKFLNPNFPIKKGASSNERNAKLSKDELAVHTCKVPLCCYQISICQTTQVGQDREMGGGGKRAMEIMRQLNEHTLKRGHGLNRV